MLFGDRRTAVGTAGVRRLQAVDAQRDLRGDQRVEEVRRQDRVVADVHDVGRIAGFVGCVTGCPVG